MNEQHLTVGSKNVRPTFSRSSRLAHMAQSEQVAWVSGGIGPVSTSAIHPAYSEGRPPLASFEIVGPMLPFEGVRRPLGGGRFSATR